MVSASTSTNTLAGCVHTCLPRSSLAVAQHAAVEPIDSSHNGLTSHGMVKLVLSTSPVHHPREQEASQSHPCVTVRAGTVSSSGESPGSSITTRVGWTASTLACLCAGLSSPFAVAGVLAGEARARPMLSAEVPTATAGRSAWVGSCVALGVALRSVVSVEGRRGFEACCACSWLELGCCTSCRSPCSADSTASSK